MLGITKEVTASPCDDARYKQLFTKPSLTVEERHEWDSLRTLCEARIAENDRIDHEEAKKNFWWTTGAIVLLTAAVLVLAHVLLP